MSSPYLDEDEQLARDFDNILSHVQQENQLELLDGDWTPHMSPSMTPAPPNAPYKRQAKRRLDMAADNSLPMFPGDSTASEQTTSEQTTSEQTTSDQTTSDQTTSDQTTSDQTTSDPTTSMALALTLGADPATFQFDSTHTPIRLPPICVPKKRVSYSIAVSRASQAKGYRQAHKQMVRDLNTRRADARAEFNEQRICMLQLQQLLHNDTPTVDTITDMQRLANHIVFMQQVSIAREI